MCSSDPCSNRMGGHGQRACGRQTFASSPGFVATNLACERCSQLYLRSSVEHSWDSADTAKSSFEGLIHIYTPLLKVTLITINKTILLGRKRSVLTKTLKRFIARIKITVNGFEINSEVKHFLLIMKGYQCAQEGCVYIKIVQFSHSNSSLLRDTTILHSFISLYYPAYTNSTICVSILVCVSGGGKSGVGK